MPARPKMSAAFMASTRKCWSVANPKHEEHDSFLEWLGGGYYLEDSNWNKSTDFLRRFDDLFLAKPDDAFVIPLNRFLDLGRQF